MSEQGLTAGEVARRLGVAVTTLRAWHRRYGLGPSRHVPGQHRRYTAGDVSRLDVMRRLTGRGVPAAEAARVATARAPSASAARDGGGHAIAVGRADPAARGLARAAMRLDVASMREAIAVALRERGVVETWDALLCPVLVGIGERHAATGGLIAVEHLLSRCISDALAQVRAPGAAVPPPAGASTRVLLACADDEQHSLPLEALAAALAERGVATRLLGARVPPVAILDAIRRTGPAVVVLWSHDSSTGDRVQLETVLAARPRPIVVMAAGPGWGPAAMPDGVATPPDLSAALTLALIGR
jgi:DNA-binding transcriptional MerR regulator